MKKYGEGNVRQVTFSTFKSLVDAFEHDAEVKLAGKVVNNKGTRMTKGQLLEGYISLFVRSSESEQIRMVREAIDAHGAWVRDHRPEEMGGGDGAERPHVKLTAGDDLDPKTGRPERRRKAREA